MEETLKSTESTKQPTPQLNMFEGRIRAEVMMHLDAAWNAYRELAILACQSTTENGAKSSDKR